VEVKNAVVESVYYIAEYICTVVHCLNKQTDSYAMAGRFITGDCRREYTHTHLRKIVIIVSDFILRDNRAADVSRLVCLCSLPVGLCVALATWNACCVLCLWVSVLLSQHGMLLAFHCCCP
jgi:hypothetical protein